MFLIVDYISFITWVVIIIISLILGDSEKKTAWMFFLIPITTFIMFIYIILRIIL